MAPGELNWLVPLGIESNGPKIGDIYWMGILKVGFPKSKKLHLKLWDRIRVGMVALVFIN